MVAGVIRLVNKAAAQRLCGCTKLRLSLPLHHHVFRQHWSNPEVMTTLTYKQRVQFMCLVATSGDLANLEFAVEVAGCVPTSQVFEAAAAAGHLHICKWLRLRGCSAGKSLSAAALNCHQHVIDWLLSLSGEDVPVGDLCDAACAAGRGGRIDLAEQLLALVPGGKALDKTSDVETFLAGVAEGCDMDTFLRVHWERHPARQGTRWFFDNTSLFEGAACSRTPDWQAKVEFVEIVPTGFHTYSTACAGAVTCPDALDRLRWLRPRGHPANSSALRRAAEVGSLAVFNFLLAEGAQLDIRTAVSAARAGHLAIVQAIHSRRALTDLVAANPGAGEPLGIIAHVILPAVEGGHLPTVAWLLEVLGPEVLGVCTIGSAARSGNTDLMSWMLARGVPWGDEAWERAVEGGSEAALELLVQHGCPVSQDAVRMYVAAGRQGDLRTQGLLHRMLGQPSLTAEVATRFAEGLSDGVFLLPVLRWLLEAGCPVDWAEVLRAAADRRYTSLMSSDALLQALRAEFERGPTAAPDVE